MPPKKPKTFTVASLNLNGIRSAERKGFTKWLKESAEQGEWRVQENLLLDVRDQVAAAGGAEQDV